MEQVETLGQRVDELLVLRSVLAQVNLRLAVAGIAVVLALREEVAVRLVVVLVDDGHAQFVGQLPTVLQVGVAGVRAGAGSTHDDDVGIFGRHLIIYILEAIGKRRRNLLFVAQSEVLQAEGLRVAGIGAHLGPFVGGGVAVGPLNEVDGFSYPLVHLAHGDDVLSLVLHAPAAVGSLTADATGQDRQWLHTQVLAELEVLIVA